MKCMKSHEICKRWEILKSREILKSHEICRFRNLVQDFPSLRTPRAGLILAGKSAKTGPPGPLLLPNLVRPDQFWLPKMVPSCQNQSPMGDRFWQKIICQNRSPSKWHSYSCAHMATWMQLLYHLASLYPII